MSEEMTDQEIDDLMSSIENPSDSSEIPMSAPEVQEQEVVQEAAPEPQMVSLNVNGEQVQVPQDRALQWAQQGRDYAQKMEAFKQQQSEFENRQNEFNQQFETYKNIDQYAKDNPEWWDHVNNQWENGEALPSSSEEMENKIAELTDLVLTQNEKLQLIENERTQAQHTKEDAELDGQIQDIREKYPNLPWDAVDQQGRNLEQQVIDHALETNAGTFQMAFRDLMFDNLVGLEREKAKETMVKQAATNKLSKLTQPSNTDRIQPAQNIKSKNWNDLLEEAVAEVNAASN